MYPSVQPKGRNTIQIIAIAILSSVFTFATLVLFVQSGHLRLLTTSTSAIHHEFCSTTTTQCHCPPAPTCPSPAPSRKLFPKTFDPIHALRAVSPPTLATSKKVDWEAVLLPENGGFLMVEEFDGGVKGYGVSMFHSLHCLTMIRTMLLGMPMSAEHEADPEGYVKDPLHYLHCLEYLVEGVMCAADDTLEKPDVVQNAQGERVEGINGLGHVHQCRNASLLWDVVSQSEEKPRNAALIGRYSVFP